MLDGAGGGGARHPHRDHGAPVSTPTTVDEPSPPGITAHRAPRTAKSADASSVPPGAVRSVSAPVSSEV